MDERLVVSPCEGALRGRDARVGDYVCAGDVVASVMGPDGQAVPVHSPFAGWVMGFLVPHGSPVRRREPVLWLRRH
jgi:biotin carboxyl carrier protein